MLPEAHVYYGDFTAVHVPSHRLCLGRPSLLHHCIHVMRYTSCIQMKVATAPSSHAALFHKPAAGMNVEHTSFSQQSCSTCGTDILLNSPGQLVMHGNLDVLGEGKRMGHQATAHNCIAGKTSFTCRAAMEALKRTTLGQWSCEPQLAWAAHPYKLDYCCGMRQQPLGPHQQAQLSSPH